MAFNADSLLDRMQLKQQVMRWRTLAIIALVLCVIALFARGASHTPYVSKDYIARVTIEDMILTDEYRDSVLKDLREDAHVKAVIVRFNSPGGTIVGGETLHHALKAIGAQKPVVALLEDIATSGAYMGAVAAERIFSYQGTITGSIGVIFQTAEVTDLAQKLGVQFITFKSGDLKASPSPFEKITPKVNEAMQASIKDAFMVFVDMVAKGRPMLTRDEVLALADGRVYTGRQALDVKLIDAIGSEEDVVAWLEKEKQLPANLEVRDVEIVQTEDKWQKMLDIMAPNIVRSLSRPFSGGGLMAIWSPTIGTTIQ